MTDNNRSVSVERTIEAPADTIFAILTDPAQHPIIDGSGTVKSLRSNPGHLELGSKFGMAMKLGVPYAVKNTVVEFEPDRQIAWCHFAKARWRYELFPTETGTRVVETFDWSNALGAGVIEAMGFPAKNKVGMERTLERLDKLVTTGSVT